MVEIRRCQVSVVESDMSCMRLKCKIGLAKQPAAQHTLIHPSPTVFVLLFDSQLRKSLDKLWVCNYSKLTSGETTKPGLIMTRSKFLGNCVRET